MHPIFDQVFTSSVGLRGKIGREGEKRTSENQKMMENEREEAEEKVKWSCSRSRAVLFSPENPERAHTSCF